MKYGLCVLLRNLLILISRYWKVLNVFDFNELEPFETGRMVTKFADDSVLSTQ